MFGLETPGAVEARWSKTSFSMSSRRRGGLARSSYAMPICRQISWATSNSPLEKASAIIFASPWQCATTVRSRMRTNCGRDCSAVKTACIKGDCAASSVKERAVASASTSAKTRASSGTSSPEASTWPKKAANSVTATGSASSASDSAEVSG